MNYTQRLVASAVVGGVGSVAGGGSFANGAVTGAFGYMFNAAAGRLIGGYIGAATAGGLAIESGPGAVAAAWLGRIIGGNIGSAIEDSLFPTVTASGAGRAPNASDPNSIYEQRGDNDTLRSRTFYDDNGQPFARQDFDHSHFIKELQRDVQPHEHNFAYNSAGQRIQNTVRPLPSGY